MLRIAVFIGAGILAALAFACAPYPSAGPPGAAGYGTVASGTSMCTAGQLTSASQFAAAVKVLKPGYDPTQKPYSPPEDNVQNGYQLDATIISDFTNAFSNAPLVVQNSLCNLTGAFINSTGCPNNGDVNNCGGQFTGYLFSGNSSWGFRGTGHAKGNTYIAISGGLWSSAGSAYAEPFSTYENSILRYYANWSPGPSIATATPNTSWMTVLAALAHELGHVRRAEVAIPKGYGNDYDFSALTACSIGGGQTIDFYSGWNYGGDKKNLEPPGSPGDRWRSFGNNANNYNGKTDHAASPLLASLNINQAVDQLLQSTQPNPFNVNPPVDQPWASVFAAQNPDEDFAETYVLYALLGNKLGNPGFAGNYLQNLPATIPLGFPLVDTRDVPSDLFAGYKPTLKQKIQCLGNLP